MTECENSLYDKIPEVPLEDITQTYSFFDKCIPLVDVVQTYQGEGPNCGKRMTLVRFKYCNKACPFCDTQKMMNTLDEKLYSLKDISLLLHNSNGLMITGGEPTLMNIPKNQNTLCNFNATVFMLSSLGYNWADIETNGFHLNSLLKTISNMPLCKQINISWSPKFIQPDDYKINVQNAQLAYILKYDIKPILKIVISKEDNDYKKFLYEMVTSSIIPSKYIYLMPLGVTYDEINESMDECLKIANELSCNVSSRLQILHKFA